MLSKIECVESDINKQQGRTTQIAPIKLEKKQDKSKENQKEIFVSKK